MDHSEISLSGSNTTAQPNKAAHSGSELPVKCQATIKSDYGHSAQNLIATLLIPTVKAYTSADRCHISIVLFSDCSKL